MQQQGKSDSGSSSILDSVPWKHRVKGEPLDVVSAQRWVAWCGPSERCRLCGGLDDCLEVTFEWGDTRAYEYFSELCMACYSKLRKECRNVNAGTAEKKEAEEEDEEDVSKEEEVDEEDAVVVAPPGGPKIG